MSRLRTAVGAAALALITSSWLITGCSKNGGSASSGAAQNDAALVSAGQSIFSANNCARCHSINGQGGRMGPDLSREGSNPSHNAQWIAAHVKNPRSHNPSSRMPAFQQISDKDLLALGTYLASLK